MTALSDLPLHLQEKIIQKLKLKSYCRLQQTCKRLAELFRTDNQIQLHRDYRCSLEHGTMRFLNKRFKIQLDRHSFYGIGFKELLITIGSKEHYDQFCNRTEEFRTTCTKLCLFDVGTSYQMPREQCEQLLGILKPTKVYINTSESNRFEAVFSLEKITDIDLTLDVTAEDMLPILDRFFSRFRKVAIGMKGEPMPSENLYPFIKSVLELLNSTSWPHLRKFSFATDCDDWLPDSIELSDCSDILLEEFQGYQPAIEYCSWSEIRMSCPIRQQGTCCSVKFMDNELHLFYKE